MNTSLTDLRSDDIYRNIDRVELVHANTLSLAATVEISALKKGVNDVFLNNLGISDQHLKIDLTIGRQNDVVFDSQRQIKYKPYHSVFEYVSSLCRGGKESEPAKKLVTT